MTETALELENLSDEEREALADEDVGTVESAEKEAKAAEAITDDGKADDVAKAEPELAPDPITTRLAAPTMDGHDEQLAALLDQRKTIRGQYREGDLSAEEKDRLEDEINDKIADLRADQKLAQYTESNNQHLAETEYLRTVAAVRAEILEKDGVDYNTNKMLEQNWDLRVRALASDPANVDRSARWYLEEAHKQVMAEAEATARALGFQRGDAQPPRTDAERVRDAIAARRPPADGARSLSSLPIAADTTGREGAEFSHLDNLSGDDLESAVARMTPEQQDRWART